MKLFNQRGDFNLRVPVPGGYIDISPKGTEVPDEIAELIIEKHGHIIKKVSLKSKKEVK